LKDSGYGFKVAAWNGEFIFYCRPHSVFRWQKTRTMGLHLFSISDFATQTLFNIQHPLQHGEPFLPSFREGGHTQVLTVSSGALLRQRMSEITLEET
jgi:hypothetical protein